ncbi:MAG: hypothetical protein GY851_00475 [bacterium]|nr:hypothetical protein [bacterium]
MKVLVACEFSGIVRDAFRARGHDAWSCDILPCEASEEWHYRADVKHVLPIGWDLMIAHPPCTYLTNAGVCWLHRDPQRWGDMAEGAAFFKELMDADIPQIAVENPIMHKYAVEIIGRRQDQVVQPWMFGHLEKKATCLWLKNLPQLVPTSDLKADTDALPKNQQQRLHYLPPGPNRARERSRTYTGIARAMAEQWG